MGNNSPFMNWLRIFTGRSDSTFVKEEVLDRLPTSIKVRFTSEFDADDNPIIFISSPDYEGIISEARTYPEAIDNAQDAILTYFDVPRDCASLIEFDVIDAAQSTMDIEGQDSIRVREFKIKELSNA